MSNTVRDIETNWQQGDYFNKLSPDEYTLALWHFDNDYNDSGQYKLVGLSVGSVSFVDGIVSGDMLASPTPTPSCSLGPSGDLNCNGRIDVFDLTLLLGNFGSTSFPTGDLNNNGRVDIFDLTILLGNFGRSG